MIYPLRAASRVLVLGALISCHASAGSESAEMPNAGDGVELYGAGLFSTSEWDFFMAFSPDQRRVLFCRANADFSNFDIYETRLGSDERWSAPVKPRFAMQWSNADPHITLDGNRVFYISNRPNPGDSASVARPSYDVWYADRGRDGEWGEARHLPGAVNNPRVTEWSPTIAANGNMYVGTIRRGGVGGNDIWLSRMVNGEYQALENLGDSVNTAAGEIEPWISPDESYLIFSGAGRADSIGGYDLYISFKQNGVWQRARPLGGGINSNGLDFNQSVSPDGEYIYFSSTRARSGPIGERFDWPRNDANIAGIGDTTRGDIYRVPVSRLGIQRR